VTSPLQAADPRGHRGDPLRDLLAPMEGRNERLGCLVEVARGDLAVSFERLDEVRQVLGGEAPDLPVGVSHTSASAFDSLALRFGRAALNLAE
jgi:hypothetical protein